jgi:hypothetical protein
MNSPPVQEILAAIGWTWIAVAVVSFGLAMTLPRKATTRVVLGAIVGAATFAPMLLVYDEVHVAASSATVHEVRAQKAHAMFAERCSKAGEKIYKTVDAVDGVYLKKVRAAPNSASSSDPNWQNAALPREGFDDWYIISFLGWEQRQGDGSWQGPVNLVPTNFPGYSFADVDTAQGLQRYVLKEDAQQRTWRLNSTAIPTPVRYSIDFENPIDPEARANWIAETVITVRDLKSGELLAERRSFAFDPGFGSTNGGRQPWMYATLCPRAAGAQTRAFVEKVLKKPPNAQRTGGSPNSNVNQEQRPITQ